MKNNGLQAVCLTHIGKRLNHEDNFLFYGKYLTSDIQEQMINGHFVCMKKKDASSIFKIGTSASKMHLFVVSDGMGGHNAGEVASRICVEKLAEKEKELQDCSSIQEAVLLVQDSIQEINDIVCEMSHKHAECKGMGATLVLLLVCGTDYAILNVGDSRGYVYNQNGLVQITKDHTEGQRMLDLGILTRKELEDFSARKNLNRYIGYGMSGFVLQADEYYPVIEDELLLLCSDGISDFLSENQIFDILQSESDLEIMGKRLIEEAVVNLNADNATVILVRIGR